MHSITFIVAYVFCAAQALRMRNTVEQFLRSRSAESQDTGIQPKVLSDGNQSHWAKGQTSEGQVGVNPLGKLAATLLAFNPADPCGLSGPAVSSRTRSSLGHHPFMSTSREVLLGQQDAAERSFTTVAQWPALKLFTFGECAFRGKQEENHMKFPGARVVVQGDPVSDVIGQAVGFQHHKMVPVTYLEIQEPEEVEEEETEEQTQTGIDANFNTFANISFPMPLPKSIFAQGKQNEAASKKHKDVGNNLVGTLSNLSLLVPNLTSVLAQDTYDNPDVRLQSVVKTLANISLPIPNLKTVFALKKDGDPDMEELSDTSKPRKSFSNMSFPMPDVKAVFTQNTDDAPDLNQILTLKEIFAYRTWARHLISCYTLLLKQEVMQQTKGSASAKLAIFRMALLTELMSYVDSNVANVEAAVELLNAEVNPIDPRQPLFEKKLEHLMTLQFFSPARPLSRALNGLGIDRSIFGFDSPPWDQLQTWRITEQGIVHNVHLLRDADNNGYLTLQGTANLGTYFDVHAAFSLYDPDAKEMPLGDIVDDARWEAIESCFLRDCHTGLCNSLIALVSNDEFPMLARRITNLSSLSVVGHSSGGSLASMLAMCVHGVQDLQRDNFSPSKSRS